MSIHESTLQMKDGVQLYTRRWQTENKPRAAITLIHGLGEHCARYDHVAAWYNQRGMSVMSMDLRGHGRSPGIRGDIPSYDICMEDIDVLFDENRKWNPDVPVFLYGHSMGGSLGLYYLLSRKPKINGAVITSAGLAPAVDPGFKLVAGQVLNWILPKTTMPNGLDLSGISHDQKVIDAYKADENVHPLMSARLGIGIVKNGQWILSHAGELSTPTLYIQGDQDRLVSVDASYKFWKAAPSQYLTSKAWENGYHELHNEPFKEDVFQYTLAWLESHITHLQ